MIDCGSAAATALPGAQATSYSIAYTPIFGLARPRETTRVETTLYLRPSRTNAIYT